MKGRPKINRDNWACKRCGSGKYSHYADYCRSCYNAAISRKRYADDPIYREKVKVRHRKYATNRYYKKMEEDPGWNARIQRKYRKNHPEMHNFIMCKCYFRRLSPEMRERLITEIEKEEKL
jgi:hypothetical protein